MKKIFEFKLLIFLILFCLLGCNNTIDKATETEHVQNILQGYFNALADRDWEELKGLSTDDMILLENGVVWNNDSLIQGVDKLWEGFDLQFTLDYVSTNMDNNTAWIYYKNSATAHKDTLDIKLKWLESAHFVKQNNEWKISFLHSTLIPE